VAVRASLFISSHDSSSFRERFSFQSFLPASVRRERDDFFLAFSAIDAFATSEKSDCMVCSVLWVERRIRFDIHEKMRAPSDTKNTQRKYTTAIIAP
jgi:hypothetical protein